MSTPKTAGSLIPESFTQFYRRMAKAFRSPAPPDAVAIAELSRVVELHHRAANVILAAIELSDEDGREQLEDLGGEETRLAHAVGELVVELGGSPPRPEESSQKLPRDQRAMSQARGRAELLAFVDEDLAYVTTAQRALASCAEIPLAIRERVAALGKPSR